ncbi:hypothetical protein PCE1_004808 [Barthelona sp. PCE]
MVSPFTLESAHEAVEVDLLDDEFLAELIDSAQYAEENEIEEIPELLLEKLTNLHHILDVGAEDFDEEKYEELRFVLHNDTTVFMVYSLLRISCIMHTIHEAARCQDNEIIDEFSYLLFSYEDVLEPSFRSFFSKTGFPQPSNFFSKLKAISVEE